nr:LysR substrate-binding domain-containing protein [Cupriavidus lacunae]
MVSGRFDAGVRRGRLVAKDMIAVRIGPDIPMTVAGAPSYFARHAAPKRPPDLVAHACLNLRLPTHGEFLPWTFMKAGKEHRIKVDGPMVFNSITPIRDAAVAGVGLAYLPEAYVTEQVASGRLVQVLGDWRKTFEGYHLYCANRRHASSGFALLVEALRYSKQQESPNPPAKAAHVTISANAQHLADAFGIGEGLDNRAKKRAPRRAVRGISSLRRAWRQRLPTSGMHAFTMLYLRKIANRTARTLPYFETSRQAPPGRPRHGVPRYGTPCLCG